jgi:hypothetical protein
VFERFYTLLLIFLAIGYQNAPAEEDPGINFRERCRRTISGSYGAVLADARQADDAVVLAENFRTKSKAQIERDEKKLRHIKAKLQATNDSPDLLSERDVLYSKIKLYHEQLTNSEDQIASARKQQKDARRREASMRLKIQKIFKIEMNEDPDGGPRPVFSKIEWNSPCPKYRSLCPLPDTHAQILIALLDDVDDPSKACFKYSKLK